MAKRLWDMAVKHIKDFASELLKQYLIEIIFDVYVAIKNPCVSCKLF